VRCPTPADEDDGSSDAAHRAARAKPLRATPHAAAGTPTQPGEALQGPTPSPLPPPGGPQSAPSAVPGAAQHPALPQHRRADTGLHHTAGARKRRSSRGKSKAPKLHRCWRSSRAQQFKKTIAGAQDFFLPFLFLHQVKMD